MELAHNARELVEREFNLSHAAEPPSHNDVSAGRWTSGEAGAISVETLNGTVQLSGFAKTVA